MAKSEKTLHDLFHETLNDIYFAEKKKTLARELGFEDAVELLDQTLAEEKRSDEAP